jgi:membrane-associated phospholipid phosphatase
MNYLFHIVQSFDLGIYQFLTRFTGNWFIDRVVNFQESNQIFKGGFILAVYWWVWFRRGSDQEKRRKTIISIMFATVVAIIVTRTLAAATPFRVRPIYDANLVHRWSFGITGDFAQLNSFPSDTATYLCALAFGLIVLIPRLRVPIVLYTAGWFCFPRIYLGYHYVSDVVVGAAIGVVVVWGLLRAEWLQSAVSSRVVAFADLRPDVFYAAAFLITFEMAVIFWDVRELGHRVVHVAKVVQYHNVFTAPKVVYTALLLLVAAAIVILLKRQSARGRKRITPKSR